MENTNHVEDPNIVKGGPMDPTSEMHPANAQDVQTENPAENAPLYKGFDREIKTQDELVQYVKDLETTLVRQPVAMPTPNRSAVNAQSFAPKAPTAAQSSGDSFEELVYSDPAKAKSVLLEEFRSEQRRQADQARAEQEYWSGFYEKNPDLKDFRHIVQSVFDRDSGSIRDARRFPSNDDVTKHLAKETRQIIDLVKSKSGVTETHLPSNPAMTFGGTGGVGANNAPAPKKPQSFAEQITRFRKRAK